MSIDINLVNKKTSEGSRDVRLRKVKATSFAVLIIVAMASVVLFLVNLRFSVNYVRGQQNKIIQELSVYDEKTSKIFILNQRLTDIESIITQRKNYQKKTELIFEKIPTTLLVQEYQINESGIFMELNSTSLLDIDDYLNYLLELSKSKALTYISLDEISSGGNGYLMKLSLN